MYGTVARIKIKPGTFEKFRALSEEQGQDTADGAVSVAVFQTNEDPDELYLVAVFEDEESYYANADRPETSKSYEKMAELFAEDPQWHDGQVIYYQKYG